MAVRIDRKNHQFLEVVANFIVYTLLLATSGGSDKWFYFLNIP